MLKPLTALVALGLAVSAATLAEAQAINQTVPGHSPGREAQLAPMREGAARMQQFESVRRLAEYSPAERQRVHRRATGLLTASNTSCDIVNAVQLGMTERRRDIIEVSCSSGFGYLLVGGSPTTAYDCLQIAEAARVVRVNNPRADVGSQCVLPENGG